MVSRTLTQTFMVPSKLENVRAEKITNKDDEERETAPLSDSERSDGGIRDVS
jgi:hypothetical protein